MPYHSDNNLKSNKLRYGWTTGATAAAAAVSAFSAWLNRGFIDPVTVYLPNNRHHTFSLAEQKQTQNTAMAAIIKDAGDDPDVTHGALIRVTLKAGTPGQGLKFRAGPGVGTITKPGLPLPVGEAAINPNPRKMIADNMARLLPENQSLPDLTIEISVPNGEKIAKKTWNPRLGIVGGISILGTTGIVTPYSCSAWIHSIHRGIDVARASQSQHIAAAAGSTSERLILNTHKLETTDLIDMGNFVGGMMKYLRKHPLPNLTIAGGLAKMTKLAQGATDLHSSRSQINFTELAKWAYELGYDPDIHQAILNANSALNVYSILGKNHPPFTQLIAKKALEKAREMLQSDQINLEVLIASRNSLKLASYHDKGFLEHSAN